MFEVWSNSEGLGAFNIFTSLPSVFSGSSPFPKTGGGSLVKAVQQGKVKLSLYNPNHPRDRWGRPIDLYTPGQAVLPPTDYHPRAFPVEGDAQVTDWGFPAGRVVSPPLLLPDNVTGHGYTYDPVGGGGTIPPYALLNPYRALSGIGGITDTLSNLWTNHKLLLLAGGAAVFLMMGKHRR